MLIRLLHQTRQLLRKGVIKLHFFIQYCLGLCKAFFRLPASFQQRFLVIFLSLQFFLQLLDLSCQSLLIFCNDTQAFFIDLFLADKMIQFIYRFHQLSSGFFCYRFQCFLALFMGGRRLFCCRPFPAGFGKALIQLFQIFTDAFTFCFQVFYIFQYDIDFQFFIAIPQLQVFLRLDTVFLQPVDPAFDFADDVLYTIHIGIGSFQLSLGLCLFRTVQHDPGSFFKNLSAAFRLIAEDL